jgi:hypothetical protein
MKRLALLSVVTLMMASAVFAPVAMALEPGEVVVKSATLGPGGSVTVTGTIQCVQGYNWLVDITVRQRTKGNLFNTVGSLQDGYTTCTTDELTDFTVTGFGAGPFHRGPASVSTFGEVCSPEGFPCDRTGSVVAVHLR